MNKRRALIGYQPKAVHDIAADARAAFLEEKRRLEEELDKWAAGNDELAAHIAQHERQLAELKLVTADNRSPSEADKRSEAAPRNKWANWN